MTEIEKLTVTVNSVNQKIDKVIIAIEQITKVMESQLEERHKELGIETYLIDVEQNYYQKQ